MKVNIFAILLLALIIGSCKRAEDRRCWKPKGKMVTEGRMMPSFNKLSLHDGMDYVLIQDSLDFVNIKAGENLINLVNTTVVDGELTIKDDNMCNFLRELPIDIQVEIHYTSITDVYNDSYGKISGEIDLPNGFFHWDNWSGATRIDLELHLDTTQFALHTGAPSLIARGDANMMWLFTSGYCQIDCRGLEALNGQAHNVGIGDIYINVAGGWLNCVVEDYGNVYHSSMYGELHQEDRGEGGIFEY